MFFRSPPFMLAIFMLLVSFALATVQAARGDTSGLSANTKSCSEFVQHFYDWYLRGPEPRGSISKYDYTLKVKSAMFTPDLRQKLEADEQASAKNPGEIVGLDFDPFLNAQDTPERLVVGKATMQGCNCFVEVYRFFRGAKENKKPDVTPELTFKNGHWVFVNFHYSPSNAPDERDLLSILKKLSADRANNFGRGTTREP